MSTTNEYVIAVLDSNGDPANYLPVMGEGWQPGTVFQPVADRALAWKFADKQTAEETADVINAHPGNDRVAAIEL